MECGGGEGGCNSIATYLKRDIWRSMSSLIIPLYFCYYSAISATIVFTAGLVVALKGRRHRVSLSSPGLRQSFDINRIVLLPPPKWLLARRPTWMDPIPSFVMSFDNNKVNWIELNFMAFWLEGTRERQLKRKDQPCQPTIEPVNRVMSSPPCLLKINAHFHNPGNSKPEMVVLGVLSRAPRIFNWFPSWFRARKWDFHRTKELHSWE